MCGILGITTKKDYSPKALEQMVDILLRLSESRGKEAAGLAVKRKESIDVLKLPLSASNFLKSPLYGEFSKNVLSALPPLSIIGHSRLATHGNEGVSYNNQPVIKDKAVCVHNGIIANDEDLWRRYPQLKRNYQVDTEVFLGLLQMFLAESCSIPEAVKRVFGVIEGSASAAVLFNNNYSLTLATNTGSLYVCENQTKDTFIFTSERYIFEQFIDKVKGIDSFKKEEIEQLSPGTGLLLNTRTLDRSGFDFSKINSAPGNTSVFPHPEIKFINYDEPDSPPKISFPEVLINDNNFKLSPETKKVMYENWQRLYSFYDDGKIKRCAKCLLPGTMTFIDFDERGVCNYCRNYKKIGLKSKDALEEAVAKYRRSDGRPDCIVGFSGGRDSSYGLHYVKKVLKLNPVAYTYDWGVLTDLGRRNQARVCGKLGVEHIIISADIRQKRKNVLTNINAWLKKPELGVIPILMAGDKKHISYGEWLKKKMGIKLLIYCCGSGFENDFFKVGLAGVHMTSDISFTKIPALDKIKLTAYYAYQYIRNPLYINRSLLDTMLAYYVSIFLPFHGLYLFNYIKWDEKEILSTIIHEYNWEREPDTSVTWRIDDGTAAFYNYIYLTATGLTEFDVLRSIQIKEGQITKEEARDTIREENRPRFELMEWYARIIGFDINKAVKRINEIPKFYLRNKR